MRADRVHHRATRLDQLRQTRETERCLQCLAAELELEPELLRREAIALVERFAVAGVTTIEAKLALVAEELAMPLAELRRKVDEVAARCR